MTVQTDSSQHHASPDKAAHGGGILYDISVVLLSDASGLNAFRTSLELTLDQVIQSRKLNALPASS